VIPTERARPANRNRGWGFLGWAKWLPEIGNAAIVASAVLLALTSLVSYSDDEIRQSLVDTYEPSAWNFIGVCILAVLGVIAALVAKSAAVHSFRRRMAIMQIALMLTAVVVAASGHYRLMQRTTRLTGQAFGGFP